MGTTSEPFYTIVGSGKLAQALGRVLGPKHATLVSSRTFAGIEEVSQQENLVVIIAVSDDALRAVTEAVAAHLKGANPCYLHCSGVISSTLFSERGLCGASFHPAISIGSDTSFRDVLCALEGEARAIIAARQLASLLGAQTFEIKPSEKTRYHLAAVMAANFTSLLLQESYQQFLTAGLPATGAQALVRQLFESSLPAALSDEFAVRTTGPAVRRDNATIEMHQEVLSSEDALQRAYTALTQLMQQRVPRSDER
jgi:predicted short-subunit dehydrogenase-like oxidoreductase (DUF2520 family)